MKKKALIYKAQSQLPLQTANKLIVKDMISLDDAGDIDADNGLGAAELT